MTGTNCDLFTHKSFRSYLNHLVLTTGVSPSVNWLQRTVHEYMQHSTFSSSFTTLISTVVNTSLQISSCCVCVVRACVRKYLRSQGIWLYFAQEANDDSDDNDDGNKDSLFTLNVQVEWVGTSVPIPTIFIEILSDFLQYLQAMLRC
jgi:hypothetical protein